MKQLLHTETERNFEDARQTETRRAASKREKLSDLINSSETDQHIITHPICYDCGSFMILLNDGKFCPACGRLVFASDEWKDSHLKYSGVA